MTFELTVDQASQTLTGFAYSPATVTFGGTAPTLTAPSGAQGTLSYASSDTSVCSVDEDTGVLGIEGAGSCTITAAAAATDDGNYQATSVTFELTVDQASQTLTGFAYSPATVTFGGTAPTLTAPSGAQGTLSYASSDTSVCSVDEDTGVLGIEGAGSCTITAAAAATDDGNYQATSVTFALTVNSAPTAADKTVTINEDTAHPFEAADFGFQDADGNALDHVTIVSLQTQRRLKLGDMVVTTNQPVSKADLDDGKLIYTPPENANGNNVASFDFTVNDGTADSEDKYTVTIDVTAMNDPPTASDKMVTIGEDKDYVFAARDFGFSDVDARARLHHVTIVSLPEDSDGTDRGTLTFGETNVPADYEVQMRDINKLIYTPLTNENGSPYASFDFTVNDGMCRQRG